MNKKSQLRVVAHPILGDLKKVKKTTIEVDEKTIPACIGEPIAAALMAACIRVCRKTTRKKQPRGYFCGRGKCTDCVMIVNGRPNVRTCITPVTEGMIVQTQNGLGNWKR